jgi:glycosyltransferase involved in cell wall biosynthesis
VARANDPFYLYDRHQDVGLPGGGSDVIVQEQKFMVDRASQRPLVAIVTPVYNGALFLAETMACVQAQTYSDLVHVVLDNASTDATPEVIERAKGGRVPVRSFRNVETLSLWANWDKAVRLIPDNTAYFLLLCADDLIAPSAIEKLVTVAQSDLQIGVVGCLWATGPSSNGDVEHSRSGLPRDRCVFDGRWIVKSYLMQMHFATSPQCQLFRRNALTEPTPFYLDQEMLTDVDACLRTLLDWKYGFVHQTLAFTRSHNDRLTAKVSEPEQQFTANWLALIDRYGPSTMATHELDVCRRAYLRYYYRRLLVWRFRNRNKALYAKHILSLDRQGARPTLFQYAVALFEWIWLAARGRRNEVSTARTLWPEVWTELVASGERR